MYSVLKYIAEMALMTALFYVCDTAGEKKYIFALVISLLLLIWKRKEKRNAEIFLCIGIPAFVYLLLGLALAVIQGNVFMSTIKIVVFWLIPLFFAYALYNFYGNDIQRLVDMEFWGCSLIFVYKNFYFLLYYYRAESSLAFVFGIFFVYYFVKKRWFMLIPTGILTLVSDKRIAVVAICITLLIKAVSWIFRNDKRLIHAIWGLQILLIYGYLWFIYSGKFAYYCQGIGMNTNGRTRMYEKMIVWFGKEQLFIGKGIGIVEQLLGVWNVERFANLHNDFLKFCIELGIIGLFLFLASYGVSMFIAEKNFGNKKMCEMLMYITYFMILLMTDNASIYIFFLIPFYSLLFSCLSDDTNENSVKSSSFFVKKIK